MKNYDLIVIGAGAAGLIAAGHAAELGEKVLLVEKMGQAGRKILITGKGRCNITNTASLSEFLKHVQANGKFLRSAFSAFFSNDIIKLLNTYGVDTTIERGGRVFPTNNQASDVLNALLLYIKKHKVEIIYSSRVTKLIVENCRISGIELIQNGKNKQLFCKKVIIATGGKSYPATGSSGDGYKLAVAAGHSIENPRPALVPLETKGDFAERLQGLSLKNVKAMVWVNGKKQKEAFGEMLFTHFGLSGPIILTISRFVVDELIKNSQVDITIDLKPALDEQKLDKRIIRDLDEHGKKQIENIFKLWLPSKMIPFFLQETGIDPIKVGHQITSKERRSIKLLMKSLVFQINGYRSFKEAIITAGGISTKEIDQKTMQSKLISNLYFAGEVIDLDADTGGFNLQIAYSTAWLAAQSCAEKRNS